MALRTTQAAAEFLLEGDPAARTTQVVAEFLVQPPIPTCFTSQVVVEFLVQSAGAEGCELAWVMPTPNPYPTAANGGPIPVYFDEIRPEWGEFGREFADGNPAYNTIQTSRIRHFVFEYDGLDQAQAQVLDDHYNSTRGGLSFTLVHQRTGEIITGVRYEGYSRGPHVRVWSQTRSVKLVKYPG